MSRSNPYAAPTDAPADPDPAAAWPVPARETAASGSSLEIAERRAFTGRWIGRGMVIAFVPLITLVGFVTTIQASDSLLLQTVSLPIALMWVAFKYEGFPPLAFGDARRLARERGGVTGEITFTPRLPGTPFELQDSGDDPGVLWLDGEWLCFEGDRVRMRIHRDDIASVRRRATLNDRLAWRGPGLVLDLARPLTGRARVAFNTRFRVSTPWLRARGKRLKRRVERWAVGGDRALL